MHPTNSQHRIVPPPQPLAAHQAHLDDRSDEAQVEQLLLTAGPRVCQSTRNVPRDIGIDHWSSQPPLPPLVEQAHDINLVQDDVDRRASSSVAARQATAAAVAEAAVSAQVDERRRHCSPTPAPARDADGNERVCRLCFADEHELDDDGTSMGEIISPCRCNGSMRYVHSRCLSQWRHKSRASDAARVCGQCSSRYLFPTSQWTPVAAFLQASQPLKIIVSFVAVTLGVILSGLVGTASLYSVATLGETRFVAVRSAALELLQPPKPPWEITLSQDAYKATVHFDSTFDQVQGIYGSRKELMIRASLDVIQKIKNEHGDQWAAYKRAQSEYDAAIREDSEDAQDPAKYAPEEWAGAQEGGEEEDGEGGDLDGFVEEDLLDVRDEGGQHLNKRIRRRRKSPTDAGGRKKTNENGRGAGNVTAPSAIDPAKFAHALAERLTQLWSGHVGDDTPSDGRDDDSDDIRRTEDGTVADDKPHRRTQGEADEEESDDVPSKPAQRKGPELAISYNFMSNRTFGDNPTQHLLVRMVPDWFGPLRYVPYAIYLTACERMRGLARVPSYLGIALTRCAVLLSILICESRREVLWTLSKVAVAAVIAFIDEHFQAAPPLPPNAVLLGPPRSLSRRIAWRVREALSFASTTVFGLYWLNWWGGLPLSTYLGPRSFSSAERVELSQLGPIFGPIATSLVDFAFIVLGNFSDRAHRFRQTHTMWWKRADWVQHDKSAAEGYRRMLSVMLGGRGSEQAKMTRYDVFLERENARLLPGRVRPVRLANIPLESRWQTVVMVGCLVTVTMALVAALGFAWEAVLVQFFQQVVRSTLDLFNLMRNCGPKLRAVPAMLQGAVRWSIEALRDYWPFSSLSSSSAVARGAGRHDGGAARAASPTADGRDGSAPPDEAHALDQAEGFGGAGAAGAVGATRDAGDGLSTLLSAMLGCCASIYGCFHASMWTVKLILTYLPLAPFAICFAMLEEWIHFDLAQQEVLDRNDL